MASVKRCCACPGCTCGPTCACGPGAPACDPCGAFMQAVKSKKAKKAPDVSAIESNQHFKHIAPAMSLHMSRSVSIIGEAFAAMTVENDGGESKVLHLIRHGQGFHNLMADEYRRFGMKWDATANTTQDFAQNPYVRPEMIDPPLTAIGRQQAKDLRPRVQKIAPDLVVVSPLVRAVETAVLGFSHCYGDGQTPWVANELARETMGVHTCDRRRDASETKELFRHIDFSGIPEKDVLWKADVRESAIDCSNRAYRLMLWLRQRKEHEVVVCAHSSLVFTLLNTVVRCTSADMGKWFKTGEMRTLRVTFKDR